MGSGGLAFLATVLNYLHWLSFNYLSADGRVRELIPDDAFAYLGAAFFLAYTVSNLFSGFVIDKLGTRLGYALCVGFWTTAGWIHAFATSPMSALIIFGISKVVFTSCNSNSLTFPADVVPKNSTASVWGISSVGAGLGGVLFQANSTAYN